MRRPVSKNKEIPDCKTQSGIFHRTNTFIIPYFLEMRKSFCCVNIQNLRFEQNKTVYFVQNTSCKSYFSMVYFNHNKGGTNQCTVKAKVQQTLSTPI